MIRISVQQGDFETGEELSAIGTLDVGAVASFTGIVRGTGGLQILYLEHYPGMTEAALHALAQTASDRWPLSAVTIIHRVGNLGPGERIVFVGTASLHRVAALESCAFLIDKLKTDVPFWKKESFADGRAQWVETRSSDADAARRW